MENMIENFEMMNAVRHAIAHQIERYQKEIIQFEEHQKRGHVMTLFGEVYPNDDPNRSSWGKRANNLKKTVSLLIEAYENFDMARGKISDQFMSMAVDSVVEQNGLKKKKRKIVNQ